ncbi:hypothetical protein H0H87_010112, partial [Tephrocybe sp. NHM501043]
MANNSENTPLLLPVAQNVEVPQRSAQPQTWTKTFQEEFIKLAEYSLPVFGCTNSLLVVVELLTITHSSQLLEFSILTVSILSIGHTSTAALSAVSLGTLTANVTAFTLMQGFSAALDTVLPSAWTSPQPHLVGLWTQRM